MYLLTKRSPSTQWGKTDWTSFKTILLETRRRDGSWVPSPVSLVVEDGRVRVPVPDSAANLTAILRRTAERGWTALVVAPPPNADDEHNRRIGELDASYSEVCAAQDVPYVRVHQPLLHNHTWMRAVRDADGYHPGAAGYEEFAALMVPYWLLWLAEPGSALPVVR